MIDRVFDEVEKLQPRAVERLRDLVAIPSVSAHEEALDEAADAVRAIVEEAGMAAEIWETEGAPAVVGRRPGPSGAPELLLYGHYDVQPPDPLDAWTTPPFDPVVRDGALFGRGAADNKGQFLAHLVGIEAVLRHIDPDLGITLLIEGEEEIGSPHLEGLVEGRRSELACDLAITSDGPVHDDGNPVVIFGARGLLYLELRARGADRDLHSGNRGGLVPGPAWEIVRALASLLDDDGQVCVPGYWENVEPPTPAERRMMAELPLDRASLLDDLGLDRLPPVAADDPWEALMFRPNLNICGLDSGYRGPGAKTVIPHRATAKIDVRLVPRQDPDRIESAIRAHLDEGGHEVDVERLAAVPPSATPADTPLAEAVIRAVGRAAGRPPWRRPRLAGTTPDFVFTRILRVPSLLVPYASPDMDNHAPDEKMRLDALHLGCRTTAAILLELERGPG